MRRVKLDHGFYRRFGWMTFIVGVIVVIIIYPLLDFVEWDREEAMEQDEDHPWMPRRWTRERETGFILLALAMTVGQLMVFIGLIMIITGAVKSYMQVYLPPKVIQCENCRMWFDMKWPWCPKCDKPVMEAPYSDKSRPHIIKVALPVNVQK